MYQSPFKKVRKTEKGASLKRWFKEEWIDVRTGKPCGRTKGDGRGVPYCRPKKRISSKTPKTASEMSATEKKKKIAEKKRLGQPAGKPRRVKSVKRRKLLKPTSIYKNTKPYKAKTHLVLDSSGIDGEHFIYY